ncbi:MAG: hypothetical protein V3V10_05635 [Planctomycetota bacterium]
MSNDNKPVHRIRLSTISAAVFKNTSGEGKVFFNVQFDRSYKDGEEWKHTKSFGRDDLLDLAKVCDLTHSWIHQQQQANRPNSPSVDDGPA